METQWPEGDDWTVWLLLGGRGSGKTRAGAEWLRAAATGNRQLFARPVERLALVAETYGDAREVMVEGASGLLAVHPRSERPVWTPSRRRLEWANGAVAQVFSSEDPDALRGPQFGAAWCDELAKWKNQNATWDMLQFALRLGDNPRQVVTTTPRPGKLLKSILHDERTHVTRMSTYDNRSHLAGGFFERIVNVYRGTRLGRQELDGELIEDRPDALWSRDLVEQCRAGEAPPLRRVVVAVDPPVTGKVSSDRCGIVVAGQCGEGRAWVLADRSLAAVSPSRWVAMTLDAFDTFDADRVVIETNQGGDMAESVLRAARSTLPITQVKASRGKYLRAEPVAHLYERGLVSHLPGLTELEDEMCDFGLNGLSSGRSPDRLDALVWALSELMLKDNAAPRVRGL
ncbi:MAG: terminase family protein [Ahrensia sp.]|nr:terminase family protein [Ahrensia sp.]